MSTPIPTIFQKWDLSTEEQIQATQWTTLQKQFIQTEIAVAAEEKVSLKFDPQNPMLFAQQEAELHGKIGILTYLLELQSTLHQTKPQE